MRYKGVPIDDISAFNTPKLYLELVALLLQDGLTQLKTLVVKRGVYLILALVTWLVVAKISIFETFYSIILFGFYWIVLGIASSIGLGTGLHTFILYLGPHIAKVALTATLCGKVPDMLPSRWTFEHFGQCKRILSIVLAVQLESFLWGLGTAIGELPPYFVAYKAAETRAQLKKITIQAQNSLPQQVMAPLESDQTQILVQVQKQEHQEMPSDELEEIVELKQKKNLTVVEKIKLFIFNHMEKYGFWAILACASIPNPLFDLAGITSGHFRIPFRTFFSATFIGKAIIKVHIQMIFIIAIFRQQTLDFLIKIIETVSTNLADSFSRTLQSKKKQFNQPLVVRQSQSFISVLWDLFITAMVLYFLKSIADAYVKQKAIALRDT